MKTLDQIARSDAKDNDIKRENANIDGNTAMGTMLKFGSESAKAYYRTYMLPDKIREAHESGDIHIHDLDFYNLTMTCCQIDLTRLFKDGFSTGHGFLREPNSIASYGALAAIAMQANQNDMHGGQSIPNFDRDMAPGVVKTYRKTFIKRLTDAVEDLCDTREFNYENPLDKFLEETVAGLEQKYGLCFHGSEEFNKKLIWTIEGHVNENDSYFGDVERAVRKQLIKFIKKLKKLKK